MKIWLLLLLAPAIVQPCNSVSTFDAGLTPTRTLHVSTFGSNATGTGSAQAPYATISFAASHATPGTAIIILPGIYPGGTFLTNLSGTAQAPIWIGGAPGQPRPIISGGSEGLHLVKPRYLVIHNLEVRDCSANGINCDDGADYANDDAARFVSFRNLFIHDIGGSGNQDGLKLSGVRDFSVIECDFARCGGAGSGSGIDHVGCHRGVIVRCSFADMSGNAIQCKGGSDDIEIRWCTLRDAGQRAVNMGGSTGFEFFRPPLSTSEPNFEARDIRVVSSLIIGSQAPFAFVGCVDCLAANNTIVTPHNWILRILQESVTQPPYTFIPCSGGRFENNIVYFDRSELSTDVNIGSNTSPSTFTFVSNLWYARDNPSASAPALPASQAGAIIGLSPRFFDPGSGNYSLRPDSPARASGVAPPASPGDIRGVCYTSPPTLGAFEICLPNCDGSTFAPLLTANDFQCFLDAFAAQLPEANCDGSIGSPTLTANDFQCFINAYASGCP